MMGRTSAKMFPLPLGRGLGRGGATNFGDCPRFRGQPPWSIALALAITLLITSSCATNRNAVTKADPIPTIKVTTLEKQIINFQFDRADVHRKYRGRLEKIVSLLGNEPKAVAIIAGHTCVYGPEMYNEVLGEMRARAVKVELRNLGADYKRLMIISKGESEPSSPGLTFKDNQLNRRVEIEVTLLEK